jgi:hypothetical protein
VVRPTGRGRGEQLLAVGLEDVEGDDVRRHLGGRLVDDARTTRHHTALQRLERQPVPEAHHQFTLEDQAIRQLPCHGDQIGAGTRRRFNHSACAATETRPVHAPPSESESNQRRRRFEGVHNHTFGVVTAVP